MPDSFDWSLTGLETELPAEQWAAMGVQVRQGSVANGLPASILLPQGRKGPAFLIYPNFRTLFEWNKSFVYVTTAAYFATRLMGADPYQAGNPDPALSLDQMKAPLAAGPTTCSARPSTATSRPPGCSPPASPWPRR